MSQRASPVAIGGFMIGALVLLVVGIITFASSSWFDERVVFISSFEESVNGLAVGAPVKFKGVPVGEVTDLLIRIDLDEKTFNVPVLYEIDLERLTTGRGTFVDLEDPATLERQVLDGLRAQLQLESFVTGQLYIELTYVSNPDPDFVTIQSGPAGYPRIPTQPSLLASLGDEAGSLAADLQAFDVGAFSRNLTSLLQEANDKLGALDVAALNASLVEAAESVEALAAAPEIRLALRDVPALTEQVDSTLLEVRTLARTLGGAVGPLQLQVETTNEEVVTTLQALRGAVEEIEELLSADAGLAYRLDETLQSLSEAADALGRLARQIEQNPSSLIRGKQQPE